nr:MAG TPA: hypothetical protein [Caudoviricetes sp.]
MANAWFDGVKSLYYMPQSTIKTMKNNMEKFRN